MSQEIKEALDVLDHEDDSQWTKDGLPVLDVVRDLVGNVEITRKDVTEAAPEFRRKKDESPPETETETETETVPEDVRLAAEIAEVDGQIQDLQEEIAQVQSKLDALSRKRDGLQESLYRTRDVASDVSARIAYINSQKKLREDKAARANQFLSRGVRSSDLDPRSPIDRSMSRKTSRGTNRPSREIKK